MKYAVLLLALIFTGCGDGLSTEEMKVDAVNGPSTEGGYESFMMNGKTIQIAKEDFPADLNWDDAMKACKDLGDGWRLPSKEELELMHGQIHLKKRGNFKDDRLYWSSSLKGVNDAWSFGFGSGQSYGGDHDDYNKKYTRHVRAVRTALKSEKELNAKQSDQ